MLDSGLYPVRKKALPLRQGKNYTAGVGSNATLRSTRAPLELSNGVYIAVFYLPAAQNICVGRLGQFHFKKGVYFYMGSAQRNLSARLKRHSSKKKSMRWHIDYLSSKSKMLGAITIPGPRKHECELAKQLSKMFEVPVPGFGASDCHCSGHLFYAPEANW